MLPIRRVRRCVVPLAFVMAPVLSCVDGPFAVVNPNDPMMPLKLSLVGGPDTVRIIGDRVLFRLVTTPVVAGYAVRWTTSDPGFLGLVSDGLFLMNGTPSVPVTVTITGGFDGRTASAYVVVLPAP